MSVVTISATYGAGGASIAPRVAAALGVPFVDRAIPAEVARKLGVPLAEAEQKDDNYDSGLWRTIASMALVPDFSDSNSLAYSTAANDRAFQEQTEAVLREVAAERGGVILGRAAALVLADTPSALHVRLDGPEENRIRRVMADTGRDERVCRDETRTNDAARTAYVRHFYRRDPADPDAYHLIVDSTALSREVVIELITRAARARGIGD